MRTKRYLLRALLLGGALLPMPGCTENPFSEEKTSPGSRQVRGSVVLSDGASPAKVYIWIEGFNFGAYSDDSGKFQLTLPPPSSQGTQGGVSGVFKIYFYVANYQIASAETFTQKGQFVYGKGDVNNNGELNAAVRLEKFLHVSTQVEPATVPANPEGMIKIHVTLRASGETVTVDFPRTCAERDCPDPNYQIGAVLLRKIDSNDVTVVQMVPGADSHHRVNVGAAPVTRSMFFLQNQISFSLGVYEAIPYLLIEGKTLPPGLIQSLGANVLELGPDYLKIPFQREGGMFEVISPPAP